MSHPKLADLYPQHLDTLQAPPRRCAAPAATTS